MTSLADIFKAYDIRGTVPDQLNADQCRAIGVATARFTGGPRILLARDMRESGVDLSHAFAEGARSEGVAIVDLGMASNGIKLCLSGARPIGMDTGLAEIEATAQKLLDQWGSDGPPAVDASTLAPMEEQNLLDEYADHVRSFVDLDVLRPLKVVADTANGMGGLVAPKVFEPLPFQVEILFPELDGNFPNHPADPIQPENLTALKAAIVSAGADVGLAFDGDADRVFLVDEHAEPVSGSLTTALVAASMLDKYPGSTVLYNCICSRVVPEVIAEHGGIGVRTRVGHSYIKAVMAETGAIFGGEHSGHYYFRENYRADSGIIAAMVVLELLSVTGKPLSELLAPYKRYSASGEINTEVPDPAGAVEKMAAYVEAANGELGTVDRLDGLTVDRGDWWYNLRPSNTEPLLRLNVEAPTDEECQNHVDEILADVSRITGA
jgi:phosphomannomutase